MTATLSTVTGRTLLRARTNAAARPSDLLFVFAGSLFIAAAAQIGFVLPFSPVPVTGQTFAVLLIGALFGARLGMITVLAYLLEGLAGLPVFAHFGAGTGHFAGPTGGYLLGFVLAAGITGTLAERGWDRRPLPTVAAMTAGTAVIFLAGLPWLAAFVGAKNVLALGFYPYLPGAAVKIALAAALLPAGWSVLTRFGRRRES